MQLCLDCSLKNEDQMSNNIKKIRDMTLFYGNSKE